MRSPLLAPLADAHAVPSQPTDHQPGGTIYVLTQAENWVDVDPQRIYTSEDLAFFSGTIYRSLESYAYSPDPVAGTQLTPDLATDLGVASDNGRTWSFTLRDGVTWQDGSPITCADVAYGVSRQFATDLMGGGPAYAILYLDIPSNDEGSEYPGPYRASPEQQDLFDSAVECSPDGRTITFHLSKPIADFNYATTLGMSPVPNPVDHPGVDIGEGYGVTRAPFANGPYKVERYTPGAGGSMILSRNEHWDRASDPIRPAFPDRWVIQFGIEAMELDRRLIASEGDDQFAIQYGNVQPENLPTIFADTETTDADFAGRAISAFDPYVRYYWIDVTRIRDEKVRQAMMVALDREAIRDVYGGDFFGDYADGFIKPTLGADYRPTGIWDTFFGQPVPPDGDPDLARRLIADAGAKAPKVTFRYVETPVGSRAAEIVVGSLARAGITVELKADCTGRYGCGILLDPEDAADFGLGGWGADWPNASTVIPVMFTPAGAWDLSQADDPRFNAAVEDALATLDRAEQARKWQALNEQAVERAWAIPTFFGRSQTLAGTKVGPIYRWPAYASWPYGVMYVTD